MEAIILFSHGSVLCGAERNLSELAARMRERGDASIVEVAFLNYIEPPLGVAVDRCIAAGATRIIIAPYFLIAGKFVTEDLRHSVSEERHRHPGVPFHVAEVIGFHESLADALLTSAAAAAPVRRWEQSRHDAALWCRENPKCTLYGTEVCRITTEVSA